MAIYGLLLDLAIAHFISGAHFTQKPPQFLD
jgi:hypothetical protein